MIAAGRLRRRYRGFLAIGGSAILGALLLVACGDSPRPAQTEADQTPKVQQKGLRPRASATAATGARTVTTGAAQIAANTAVPGFIQVAAGENHTCALRGTGQVECWGDNDHGQLDAPEDVRFQHITSGWRFSCGIQTDGTLNCWGRNNHQQADPPDGTFQSLDAGWDHACALSGTTATCWGRNANERATPPSGVEFTAIGAGAEHSCGLSSSGSLVCWGKNDDGRSDSRDGPFRALAVGIAHTCALGSDGTALCQGQNSAGQSSPPGTSFDQISAGSNHTCGSLSNGYVECWGGTDEAAQLILFGPPGRLQSISSGWLSSCATNHHGQVACWPAVFRHPRQSPYDGLLLADVSLGHSFSEPTEVFPWPYGGVAVADRTGTLALLTPKLSVVPLFDLTDVVNSVHEERGLISAAIDPQFGEFNYIYLYFTLTDPGNDDIAFGRLSRFPIADGHLIREQELVILDVSREAERAAVHYGGAVRFGSDGMLYLGTGDASCFECPQRLDSLHGKILRIDVRGATVGRPYKIPDDNPMLETPEARPEVWALGLRNPWRMAFDPHDDRLWVGDVGHSSYEEVSIVRAGTNLGWPITEGLHCFKPDAGAVEIYDISTSMPCEGTEDFTEPITSYEHAGKCAIVGGIVYRGTAIPWLYGTYLFGDFCSGQIWALDGDAETGWGMIEIADLDKPLSSFGTDANGEVLVLTFGGPVLRLIEIESEYAPAVTHVPTATIVTLPHPADATGRP